MPLKKGYLSRAIFYATCSVCFTWARYVTKNTMHIVKYREQGRCCQNINVNGDMMLYLDMLSAHVP